MMSMLDIFVYSFQSRWYNDSGLGARFPSTFPSLIQIVNVAIDHRVERFGSIGIMVAKCDDLTLNQGSNSLSLVFLFWPVNFFSQIPAIGPLAQLCSRFLHI